MSATREKTPYHQIFQDNDTARDFGIVSGMSSLALLVVTLLTAYRLEPSLIRAKAYA